jgi:hypothetical protein
LNLLAIKPPVVKDSSGRSAKFATVLLAEKSGRMQIRFAKPSV